MATVQRYVNTASTAGGDGTTDATSGSTRAYASLAEWEANSGGSATDDYIVDCCGGQDTTAVVVDFSTNITTGSITIRANAGKADGFYDGDAVISTSHYRLEPGNVTIALSLVEQNTVVDGLQVIAGHTGGSGTAITWGPSRTIRRCRVLNGSSTDFGIGNSTAVSGNTTWVAENNLVVGFDVAGISAIVTNFFTATVNVYHNTVYGDGSTGSGGLRYGSSGAGAGITFNIKGNAVGNCGSGNDLVKASGASTTDNFDDNAFEHSESTSGEISLGTLTDAWTSPGTSTTSDFTVKDSSSSLNVTVSGALVSEDIRGTTRSNYSPGAFEFVSAGGGGEGSGEGAIVIGAVGAGSASEGAAEGEVVLGASGAGHAAEGYGTRSLVLDGVGAGAAAEGSGIGDVVIAGVGTGAAAEGSGAGDLVLSAVGVGADAEGAGEADIVLGGEGTGPETAGQGSGVAELVLGAAGAGAAAEGGGVGDVALDAAAAGAAAEGSSTGNVVLDGVGAGVTAGEGSSVADLVLGAAGTGFPSDGAGEADLIFGAVGAGAASVGSAAATIILSGVGAGDLTAGEGSGVGDIVLGGVGAGAPRRFVAGNGNVFRPRPRGTAWFIDATR